MTLTCEIDFNNCPNPVLRLRRGDVVTKWDRPVFRDPENEADCWAAETCPWYEWIMDIGGSHYVVRVYVDPNPHSEERWRMARLYLAQWYYSPKCRSECFLTKTLPVEIAEVDPTEGDEWA